MERLITKCPRPNLILGFQLALLGLYVAKRYDGEEGAK